MRWFFTRSRKSVANVPGFTDDEKQLIAEERVNSLVRMRKREGVVFILLSLMMAALIIESVVIMPKVLGFFDHMSLAMDGVAETTKGTARQVNGLGNTMQSANQLLSATAESMQQSFNQLNTTLNHANVVLDNLATMTKNLDGRLNDENGLVPQMTATLRQSQEAVKQVQVDAEKFSTTVDRTNETVAILNTETLPKFNQELDAVRGTTNQATKNLKTLQISQKRVDNIVAHYEKILTSPKKIGQKIAGWMIGFGEHVAAFWTADKIP